MKYFQSLINHIVRYIYKEIAISTPKVSKMFNNLLVLFVVCLSIQLPGDCPTEIVPPSSEFSDKLNDLFLLDLIAGVPFSTHHSSHLFRVFHSNNRFRMSCRCYKEPLSFELKTYPNDQNVRLVSNEINRRNGSRTLRSNVFVNNSKCYPPINDIVH